MPAQAFGSSMPGQAFDQYRGSGLDREWARLSGWRIADQASPSTGKNAANFRHTADMSGPFRGQDRSHRARQARASGLFAVRSAIPDQAFDQDSGSGLDREWARLSGWRTADQASPSTGKNAANFRHTADMSIPFRGQDRSHRAGHARASGPFAVKTAPTGQACQSRRSGDSGAGSSTVSNRWPTGSARAGPSRPGHRPGCR